MRLEEEEEKCVILPTNSDMNTAVILPVLSVLPVILTVLVTILSIVIISVVTSASSEDASSIDKVEDDTQQDKGAQ